MEPPAREFKRLKLESSGNDGSSGWASEEAEQEEARALAADRERRNVGNPLLSLPEAFLEGVFLELGLGDLANCKRICRKCNRILKDSAPLVLHLELLAASLSAPSTSRTSTTSRSLLTTLIERRHRLRTFSPSSSFKVKLEQDEGRLYEYLEGYLLRGNGLTSRMPFEVAEVMMLNNALGAQEAVDQFMGEFRRMPLGATVYDLAEGAGEWEDEDVPAQTLQDMIASASSTRSGTSTPGNGMTVEDMAEQDEVIVAAEDDDPDMYSKRRWTSEFEVKDVAMDPGQDLFVAAEMSRETGDRPWTLHLHMLSLTDFQPHPRCKLREGKLESVTTQTRRRSALVIQICDDKVFVFVSRFANTPAGVAPVPGTAELPETVLIAFEWTTGQMLFEMEHEIPVERMRGFTIMEDFILLSDRTFGVVTYSAPAGQGFAALVTAFDVHTLVPDPDRMQGDPLEDGKDPTAEKAASFRRPSCKVQHVARLVLPRLQNVVHITSRADPPPRGFFPKVKPLAVYPSPNTGIIVISFDTHQFDLEVNGGPNFYTLFLRKETIYDQVPYLDAETGGIMDGLTDTFLATLPQLVPFAQLAPYCRLMSHIEAQDWVCHTYHYRFICGLDQPSTLAQNRVRDSKRLCMLNFDPIEVRRLMCERRLRIAKYKGVDPSKVTDDEIERYDQEDSAVQLHLKPEKVGGGRGEMLSATTITGSEMPYISVWDSNVRIAQGMMLDDSRVVLISERQANGGAAGIEVLNF